VGGGGRQWNQQAARARVGGLVLDDGHQLGALAFPRCRA
jgi:hypothetical protein